MCGKVCTKAIGYEYEHDAVMGDFNDGDDSNKSNTDKMRGLKQQSATAADAALPVNQQKLSLASDGARKDKQQGIKDVLDKKPLPNNRELPPKLEHQRV